MKALRRTLPALTLFEWGAILSYFYISGRIASFLHPMFRPWVLITGILLIVTAVCVGFFPEDICEHEDEHEHDHDHAHGGLTVGSVTASFLLIIPLALATTVSPDNYGADLIRRRGLVEDIRSLPGVAGKVSPAASAVTPSPPASLSAQAAVVNQSIAARRVRPAKQSPAVDLQEPRAGGAGNDDRARPAHAGQRKRRRRTAPS